PVRIGAAFVAVDLGATSGRVMLGVVSDDDGAVGGPAADGTTGGGAGALARVELVECARFANGASARDGGGLRWDLDGLWDGIVGGLREAARLATMREVQIRGIGVCSWAVDHGLLDGDGALLAD